MEIYQLRTFIAVAREGSLARASQLLHVSQPAVSTHIRSLEEELGLTLFTRTSKGMLLTGDGGALLRHAQQTLDSVEGMMNQAKELKEYLQGDLRLGLNTDPVYLRIMEVMDAVLQEHPNLSFHLLQGQSARMADDLLTGKVDAGFMYGGCSHEQVLSLPVHHVRLRIVGPAAWKDTVEAADFGDLETLPWILTTCDCPFHCKMSEFFKAHNITPPTAALTDDETVLHSMVHSGGGMTVMREDMALAGVDRGQLVLWPKTTLCLDLSFVTLRRRKDDPLIRALTRGVERVWSLFSAAG